MPVKSFVAFDKLTADEMNSLLATKTTRNYVYNSGFDVAQRGTSLSLTSGYTLDRWYFSGLGLSSGTVSQSTALLAPNSRYSLKVLNNSTSQVMAIYQPLETADVYALAGKTVTLSAYVASSGPTTNVRLGLEYSTSVDNTVGGTWTVVDSYTTQAFTTSMALISDIVTIPSTAQSLRIVINNVSNFTAGQFYYVGNVQLEEGSFVSPWNRMGRTYADELQLCQRYYQRVVTPVNLPWAFGHAQSTTEIRVAMPLAIGLRTDPTLTVSANPTVSNGTFSAFISTTLAQSSNYAWIRITTTGTTAGQAAAIYGQGTYELSAEL